MATIHAPQQMVNTCTCGAVTRVKKGEGGLAAARAAAAASGQALFAFFLAKCGHFINQELAIV